METNNLPSIAQQAVSPAEMREQINLIQQHMKDNMREGQHFGAIPGCGDKPTLLKAGAEKLAFIFRFAPSFTIQVTDCPREHREYQVTCTLTHIGTGNIIAQGVGACSTMESKFRYRSENTGQAVPSEYWDNRDPELLGGKQFSTKKIDGKWYIFHKVEHDNPADYYNTVLKMAKKRAQVDATLSGTAASDIFTQDIEDLADNGVIDVTPKAAPSKSNSTSVATSSASTVKADQETWYTYTLINFNTKDDFKNEVKKAGGVAKFVELSPNQKAWTATVSVAGPYTSDELANEQFEEQQERSDFDSAMESTGDRDFL